MNKRHQSRRVWLNKYGNVEVTVQDDLTALTKLAITVHGHKVE